ncbi:hypothetical protein Golob_024590 [Gossypium lobatum]|uniref:DUF7745 domain-containing protein n=1 Tax=Gossypium lobatum TaxID=34289 RepID=A0A7J8NEL0_9ROSI|nr:hypothetical protein [Gossypium lobatum]
MEKRFLDKVKDNTTVRIWSEKRKQEKGNSLTEGYMSELWGFTRISFTGIDLGTSGYEEKSQCLRLEYLGLVIFPKALGHIDDAILDLFDQLEKRDIPIPTILAETFRSLSACRRASEGRFIGCA